MLVLAEKARYFDVQVEQSIRRGLGFRTPEGDRGIRGLATRDDGVWNKARVMKRPQQFIQGFDHVLIEAVHVNGSTGLPSALDDFAHEDVVLAAGLGLQDVKFDSSHGGTHLTAKERVAAAQMSKVVG